MTKFSFIILFLAGAILASLEVEARAASPSIAKLSAVTLPQAGRLKITGSGFGASQDSKFVTIGGAVAPVSSWSKTAITAYVSDNSPIGADDVQVVTPSATSNPVTLQVTTRPPGSGHVKWRFQADGDYFIGRPAVGSDGTIYAADINDHLYALTPSGGLKWIFSAGPGNSPQPVSVGLDGTIYYANINKVYAINPNGSLKWSFDTGGQYVFAGPSAGPDGNIYGADADQGFDGAIGAFVLSPAGSLISHLDGFSVRFGYQGIEVVFGQPSQWYFTNNASGAVSPAGALNAFELGTTSVRWHQGGEDQPRLQPAGNVVLGDGNQVHPGLEAFDSGGKLLWRSLGELQGSLVPGIDVQTAIDTGSDGNIYVGTLKYKKGVSLTSLNPNGTLRWQFAEDGTLTSPAVTPNNQAIVYSSQPYNTPSHVVALSSAGALLWRENLPVENGGNIEVLTVPRFSADSSTVYLGTVVNPTRGDNYSYLYAFDVGQSTDTVKITSARDLTGQKQLIIKATSSDPNAELKAYVTSSNRLIGALTRNHNGIYTGKFSRAQNPSSITVTSSAGGNATAKVTAK